MCDRTFIRKFNLKVHLRTHDNTGDGVKYECKHCAAVFAQKSNLARHEAIHELPGKCAKCPMRFASDDAFQQHAEEEHPGEENLELRVRKAMLMCVVSTILL